MAGFVRKTSQRVTHRAPNRASVDGLLDVMRALYSGAALSADDALAERERMRVESEGRLRRQGELRLRARGRG